MLSSISSKVWRTRFLTLEKGILIDIFSSFFWILFTWAPHWWWSKWHTIVILIYFHLFLEAYNIKKIKMIISFFLIKSFPFIVILQHTIQYLHVENIFKRMVYWLHKETHETISTTLDKGSMTKHASISRREAYVKLLCWVGECSHVQEILVVGQSNGSFWKINCECTRAHPN